MVKMDGEGWKGDWKRQDGVCFINEKCFLSNRKVSRGPGLGVDFLTKIYCMCFKWADLKCVCEEHSGRGEQCLATYGLCSYH